MSTHELGRTGETISMVGLGCMGMSEFSGPNDEAGSLATLHHAIGTGMRFWDTAGMYGSGHNEELVGRVLAKRRNEVFLSTKFGSLRGDDGSFIGGNGHPDYMHTACDASLQRLGVDHIDLYDQHRVDPQVPIEDAVGYPDHRPLRLPWRRGTLRYSPTNRLLIYLRVWTTDRVLVSESWW